LRTPIRGRLCIFIERKPAPRDFAGTDLARNDDPNQPDDPGGSTAVASYVATLSADLAVMARRTGLDTLGYLLEMVRPEAESSARRSHGPNERRS
jgi:hypothetical protein